MSQFQLRTRTRWAGAALTAGSVSAALLLAPQAAVAAPMVGPPIVAPGMNTTIYDPSATYPASASVQLSAAACAPKYAPPAAAGPWNTPVVTRTPNSITLTVPAAAVLMTPTSGAAKAFNACIYDGALATSSLLSSATVFVGAQLMASSYGGVTGGGNQITVTAAPNSPLFAGTTTIAAVATTGTCNPTLGAANPANLVATNVVKQSPSAVSLTVPPGVTAVNGGNPTMYNICLYDAAAPTGALLSFVMYNATVAGVSPASGSYLSSNGVTASSPVPFLSGITTPAVLLAPGNAGCPGSYSTPAMGNGAPIPITGPGSVRKLSNYRVAVTIPPLPLMNNQPTPYQLCFYPNSTTGALVATSNYTAAVVANPTAVLPAAGPSSGGSTVTVVGSDFPTDPGRISATLGGSPLINIQPISDKAFTAQTSAHAVDDNVALVVSTSAGTRALPGAYSYLNPIRISPNTAPSSAPPVDIDVQGSGFMSINFGGSGSAGRVFLVDGVYNGADAGGGVRANGPLAECVNVLAISDEELVCTLQLNRRLNSTGTGFFDSAAYTNVLTTDVSTIAGSRIVSSATGKFGPNDVGQPIVQTSNTNIPAGSIITSVLSASKAVISAPATVTSGSAFTATVGGNTAVHTFTGALSTTTGSNVVTVSAGSFSRADLGRTFNNTAGITNGTTIVSVAPGGGSATLSAPATASTQYTLAGASVADGSTTLSSAAITTSDQSAIVGPNSLGIPVGTTISAVSNPGVSATLSAPAIGGGTTSFLALNRPVNASLFAATAVPDGSYHLVVVSNGAPDAAMSDPDYLQSDITSSSTFTVAAF